MKSVNFNTWSIKLEVLNIPLNIVALMWLKRGLSTHTALAKDSNLVLSTHGGQLTTTFNSNSRIYNDSGFCGHVYVDSHPCTYTYTHNLK